MPTNDPVQLLLIEDDPIDVELFRRTARKQGLDAPIHHAADGAEGLLALREEITGPCLVFLDLNMQGMNGHDFLDMVRADPVLKRSVVFVLSSSTHSRDIARAYDRNVAGYFNKDEIADLLKMAKQYISTSCFPSLSA